MMDESSAFGYSQSSPSSPKNESLVSKLKNFLKRRPTLPFLLLILLAGSIAVVSFSMYQASQKELAELKQKPNANLQDEANTLISHVGKFVELPQDEEPNVATITDIDKERLKNQAFFEKAENGDKVLVYQKAKKIYLYSVRFDKLLDIASFNVGGGNTVGTEKQEGTAAGQVAGSSVIPATPSATTTTTPEPLQNP